MSSRKVVLLGLLVLLTVGILFQLAIALETDPTGVQTITRGVSSTFNGSQYTLQNTTAEAGNITQLTLASIGPTRSWQGFYGEISGEIVLEDANGNTMYNWTAAEPTGVIYASVGNTITWGDVACMDDADNVTRASEEALHDMASDDGDGVTETFTNNNHPTIYIGATAITGCNTTWTHVNSAPQSARFAEILLEDDTNDYGIYATVIENKDNGNSTEIIGFDGATHDFQLMVPENGTDNNQVLTTYYFWAAIS